MGTKGKKMEIIVVDSVKGGCGKTSISLKCAIEKAQDKLNKVCYMDLDLLGSSIETFLIGDRFVGKNKKSDPKGYPIDLCVIKSEKYYFNDIFKGEHFSPRFLNEIVIIEDNKRKGVFSLIACNPDQNEKDRFKPSRLMNYIGQIDYEYFGAMIERVLEQLEDMNFTHVIIDMPPNSDAYTDSVFNILLRQNGSDNTHIETKYRVKICLVNSFDRAHFSANLEWLKTMVNEHDMKWVVNAPDLFKIVFNDNINYNELSVDDAKKYVQDRLQQLNDDGIKIPCAYIYGYDKKNVFSSTSDRGVGFDTISKVKVQII